MFHDGSTIPGQTSGRAFRNPILGGNYADPSIIRVGSDYYMTNTSYKYVPGLIVWHSRDLANWEPIGSAVNEYVGDIWAPDFVYHEGLYYIYFPANRTNWVVTAESPEGPWSKPINLQTGHIDPGHVVGPDGKRYLHLSGGNIVQLADDGLSTVGGVRHVYDGWHYPADWEVEAYSMEGPKLTFKDGYYYLTVAIGGTAGPPTSHMAAVSRSRTPWGPWEHSPYNPIVRTASREERWWSRGHGSLIDTPDGTWWYVYHGYDAGFHTLGRQTLLEPVEWTEDGWFHVPAGSLPEQPQPLPSGEAVPHGWPEQDALTGDALGLQWQRFGPESGARRYEIGGNGLTLQGAEPGSPASPLLYMPAHRAYEVEVDVQTTGEAEGRLLLFYDPATYLGVGVVGGTIYHLRTFKTYRRIRCGSESLRVKLRNDHHVVSFYYSEDGGASWEKYDKVVEVSGYHHNTFGGFLSLRIGLDAVGSGSAVFRNFVYRPLQ